MDFCPDSSTFAQKLMYNDMFKKMVPFLILLGALWAAAELLERSFQDSGASSRPSAEQNR